ncbi:hypothetical protein ACFLSA_06905 [Bacteroidota bacterium]
MALIIEAFRKVKDEKNIGLGLVGALCINLSGGFVLLLWLLFGNLAIPLKGCIILWILDILLIVLSVVELIINFRRK